MRRTDQPREHIRGWRMVALLILMSISLGAMFALAIG